MTIKKMMDESKKDDDKENEKVSTCSIAAV